MNASSGSGLCPTRIRKAPDASTALSSARGQPSVQLAVEEPPLEEGEDLLARERPGVGGAALLLEHAHVVLEPLVGAIESVAELVALEDHVLRPGLVLFAERRGDH